MRETMLDYLQVCGVSVRRGYHTIERPKVFKTQSDQYFRGRFIPKNSECKFFETRDAGYVSWTEENGDIKHLGRFW